MTELGTYQPESDDENNSKFIHDNTDTESMSSSNEYKVGNTTLETGKQYLINFYGFRYYLGTYTYTTKSEHVFECPNRKYFFGRKMHSKLNKHINAFFRFVNKLQELKNNKEDLKKKLSEIYSYYDKAQGINAKETSKMRKIANISKIAKVIIEKDFKILEIANPGECNYDKMKDLSNILDYDDVHYEGYYDILNEVINDTKLGVGIKIIDNNANYRFEDHFKDKINRMPGGGKKSRKNKKSKSKKVKKSKSRKNKK